MSMRGCGGAWRVRNDTAVACMTRGKLPSPNEKAELLSNYVTQSNGTTGSC